MTTVARRDPADKAKIDAIEKKLLANPEIAKLIDDLGTSTTDANDLVRGMLQASITRGLNAEMDAHLGYESGDRSGKAAAGTDNHRNGSYPKTVDSNYGPVTVDIPRGLTPGKWTRRGVSYAALVSVADASASKSSGARRLHHECRRRVL